MNRNLVLAGILMTAFGLGGSAHAKSEKGPMGMMRMKCMKKLDLTTEQKTKMEEAQSARRDEMKALREKTQSSREALQEAFKNNASENELTKLHNELQTLKQKKAELRFQKHLAVAKILTPEQKKKMHEGKGCRGKGGYHGDEDSEDDNE